MRQHKAKYPGGTPLDPKLKETLSKLIKPGMYVLEMTDRSMVPAIPKNSILVLEEDQAIAGIVHVEYRGRNSNLRGKRFIRRCVQMDRPHHWLFSPINTNGSYPTFTSTPYNLPETVILGSLQFVLYFGSGRSRNRIIDEILEIGSFENLLKISEFNKYTRGSRCAIGTFSEIRRSPARNTESKYQIFRGNRILTSDRPKRL